MAVFTETIKLDDQVSAPAAKAAGALVKGSEEAKAWGAAMAAARAQAKALGAATDAATGATLKQAKALPNLTDALLKQQANQKLAATADAKVAAQQKKQQSEASSAAAKAAQVQTAANTKMANTLSTARDAVGSSIGSIKGAFLSLASGDVKGAIEGVADGIAGIAKLLDLVVPGLGQAVAAVISFAGATFGAVASIAKFAIETSVAKTQVLAMWDALGEGKITGEEVDGMLDDLSAKLGQTKDAMQPITQKFLQMGITGKEALAEMTTAALSAKALVGGADAGAEAFVKLTKKIQTAAATGQGLKIPLKGLGSLADMGLTVDDVATKMGVSAKKLAEELKAGTVDATKFGDALNHALIEKGAGPLETMGLSLSNLGGLLKQYIGDIFEDMMPAIKPFLLALKDLFGIFDSKTKPSGEALKTGIVAYFTKLFQVATKVVPIVKSMLLSIIIYGLKAFIAIKPLVAKVREFLNSAAGAATMQRIWDALVVVFKVLGVVVLVVVAVLLVLWAAMIAVSVAFWTVTGVILETVGAMSSTLAGWVTSAAEAAYNFIQGLVSGIASGAGAVVDAVTGLAGKAKGAFKSALGIASPSKVGRELGGNFGGSIAGGMGEAANDVHGAASGLATAAVKGTSSPAAGSASAGGNASSSGDVEINVNVTIDGAGKSAQEITDEMVSQTFQRYALAVGL